MFKDSITSEERKIDKICGNDGLNYFEQLSLVIISPTLMLNKDYAYVLGDLMNSSLKISAIGLKQLSKDDIDQMFSKRTNFKLNLIEYELLKAPSLCIVIEGQQAIKTINESIGV